MSAVIYSRISDDPRGLAAGVERQTDECRALADARGVEVLEAIEDNLTGAFQVQLATPNVAGSGSAVSGNPVLVDTTPRVQVSIVQNNPVTRDPLAQLREDSENLAAGLWGRS